MRIPSPRGIVEQDLLGDETSHRELGRGDTEWGVVGWDGDKTHEDVVELGDGTTGAQGRTLVRVTLFKGRDLLKRPEPGKAQGRRIRAQIGGPLFGVPPLGTQVIVTFPGGDQQTPGNGVITTWVQTSPTEQFKASRMVLDVGPDVDLVIKGRSVTILDHGKSEGRFPCWLTVGPVAGGTPTISCNDPTGSGWTVGQGVVGFFATDNGSPPAAKAFLQLEKSSVGLGITGSGLLKLDASGNLTIGCSQALSLVGAQVLVGALATPMTPALVGFTGLTAIPSTSVFISK